MKRLYTVALYLIVIQLLLYIKMLMLTVVAQYTAVDAQIVYIYTMFYAIYLPSSMLFIFLFVTRT